jgi:hypothetical protein
MRTYRSPTWGFRISLPDDWGEPSLLQRVLFFFRYLRQRDQPEFYGPGPSSVKFAVGPIAPSPSAHDQQRNLAAIARKYGHRVVDLDIIRVGGKEHATMVCEIPMVGVVKNYSLIFSGVEYLVTARGDLPAADAIAESFNAR